MDLKNKIILVLSIISIILILVAGYKSFLNLNLTTTII